LAWVCNLAPRYSSPRLPARMPAISNQYDNTYIYIQYLTRRTSVHEPARVPPRPTLEEGVDGDVVRESHR